MCINKYLFINKFILPLLEFPGIPDSLLNKICYNLFLETLGCKCCQESCYWNLRDKVFLSGIYFLAGGNLSPSSVRRKQELLNFWKITTLSAGNVFANFSVIVAFEINRRQNIHYSALRVFLRPRLINC